MARDDIRVHRSHEGGHVNVRQSQLAAATSLRGEFVGLDGAGQLVELGADAAATTIVGVQATGASTAAAAGLENNPRTGLPYAANDTVQYYVGDHDTEFVTANFSVAGAAFGDTAPALTDIGENAQTEVIAGVHGLQQGGAANIFQITDVLDALNRSLTEPGAGVGTRVVFKFLNSQWLGGV